MIVWSVMYFLAFGMSLVGALIVALIMMAHSEDI